MNTRVYTPRIWALTHLQTPLVSWFQFCIIFFFFLDSSVIYNPQLVEIYFETATYVEIEKDRKVTLEAQLGVIGGTMGLLTGFSILSAVEIIYFLVRVLFATKTKTSGTKVENVRWDGTINMLEQGKYILHIF